MCIRLVATTLLLLPLASGVANGQDAASGILQLYATKAEKFEIGTGFVVSATGNFVTAYHVVRGASALEVIDHDNNKYFKPTLLLVDPVNDIAVLNIDSKPRFIFKVVAESPRTGAEFTLIGHPWGFKNQTLHARATQSGFADSTGLIDGQGHGVFSRNISIIPLDVTIYGGMSGAPIIDQAGNVIGLLSGSFSEGGSLAWGIPASNIRTLMSQTPSHIQDIARVTWPNFSSYSPTFRSFTKSRSLGISETISWMQRQWDEFGDKSIEVGGFYADITLGKVSFDEQKHRLNFEARYNYTGYQYETDVTVDVLDADHAATGTGSSHRNSVQIQCAVDRACVTYERQRLTSDGWRDLDLKKDNNAFTGMWAMNDVESSRRQAMAINHLIDLLGAPVARDNPF